MRHLTLHQFLIEHVHETECKVRNVVNVTLGLSPGIPGDNFILVQAYSIPRAYKCGGF